MLEIDFEENNSTYNALCKKINDRTAAVGVIGLGYVGLPLAIEKAKAGFNVIGFDIQKSKVDAVNSGHNYIGDIVDSELAKLVQDKRISATSVYSDIKDLDIVVICVPTPLDKYQQPDISYVVNSAKEISKYLHKGMLVVLESTTYPGTTQEVLKPLLESTGLKCGIDFFLAYSPERIDPGNLEFKVKNTPKVVGGVTEKCTEIASLLYKNVLQGDVYKVSSPSAAEMEKILENTFRYVNIALVNQIAIVCNKMGIDVWEVIEAAKTKPYGFMAFYPGPGPGGHCIPIDPFYLTWKAKSFDYYSSLIDTAGEINSFMPYYIVERIIKILNAEQKSLKGSKVLLLGVAYKKDIDDYRESPVLKIIKILKAYEVNILVNDPHIPAFKVEDEIFNSTELTKELLNSSDITVIMTNHSIYDYDYIIENSKIVFDTRYAVKNKNKYSPKVVKL